MCVDVIMRVGWSENLLNNKAAIRRESVNMLTVTVKGLRDYIYMFNHNRGKSSIWHYIILF